MPEIVYSASLIMFLRICDVSLGTIRAIWVIESKKIQAGAIGFFEVLIWIFAMRYIVTHMDNTVNLFGYAIGFAIGNILGITLEQKVALGYVQVNIISTKFTEMIAQRLRESKFGVTIIPGEGKSGEIEILLIIIKRKHLNDVIGIVESIDKHAFITVQHSRPYRGFMHGSRV